MMTMTQSERWAEAIAQLHGRGLDARYDDVLGASDAFGADAAEMAKGYHYDYGMQEWFEGHDHAHIISNDDAAPMLFCGADIVTCCPAPFEGTVR